MAERILEAELTDHLGYGKHASEGRNRGNSRNGKTTKTLKDDRGDLPVEIPRDREVTFDPKLIRKYQTRWPDSGDKIISMYTRSLSTLEEVYPIQFLDALFVKIRDGGSIGNKAVYLALGVNLKDDKELLGL